MAMAGAPVARLTGTMPVTVLPVKGEPIHPAVGTYCVGVVVVGGGVPAGSVHVTIAAFENDASAAKDRYDEPFAVRGQVKELGKDPSGTPFLILAGENTSAHLTVRTTLDVDGQSNVSVGQVITIACRSNEGQSFSYIDLRSCKLAR